MKMPVENHSAANRYRRERRLARQCAVQYLYRSDQLGDWDGQSADIEELWNQVAALSEGEESCDVERARAFAERLIRGVLTHRDAVDRALRECALNWTLERMALIDRNILRVAAYEVAFCEEVPDVAAVDEAIELAKVFGHDESPRFVNGVLDQLLKRVRQAPETDAGNAGSVVG